MGPASTAGAGDVQCDWVVEDAESCSFAEEPERILDAAAEPSCVAPSAVPGPLRAEVALEYPCAPMGAAALQAVLSVVAPCAGQNTRAPLCLVAVLDKSGSMAGRKISLVRKAILFMLDYFDDRDFVGLVAFDSGVDVLAPLTACTAAGRAALQECVLRGVVPGSATNLSGGLLRGLDLHCEQPDHFDDHVVRATFLFTDGMANRGITDPANFCQAVASAMRDSGHRCGTLSTFGFGVDHDADLLHKLADLGHGGYNFVKDEDYIGTAFGQALGGLLTISYQNVRLELELEPGIDAQDLRTPYHFEITGGAADGLIRVVVDVRDLFAEERRDILVTLALPAARTAGPQLLGRLRARGFSALALRPEASAGVGIEVDRCADGGPKCRSNEHVERHRNRLLAAEAFGRARDAAQSGDFAAARRALRHAADSLEGSWLVIESDAKSCGLLKDVTACEANMEDRSWYRCDGEKTLTGMRNAHATQRACYSLDADMSVSYATDSMVRMGDTCQESISISFEPPSPSNCRGAPKRSEGSAAQRRFRQPCQGARGGALGLDPMDISLDVFGDGCCRRGLLRSTGQRIAVKQVRVGSPPELVQVGVEVQRLAAMVSSPHVVRLLGCWTQSQRSELNVVMELMDLGSMADLLRKTRATGVPAEPLAAIASQIVAGLQHLHKLSLLHRNIKPSTVLHNSQGEVKLSGFGPRPSEFLDGTITARPDVMDTFVAPESIMGEDVKPAVDVWSVGLVLFTLAAGRSPFSDCASLPCLFESIFEKPEPRLDGRRFPEPLCDFVAACLMREAGSRATPEALGGHAMIVGAPGAADLVSWLANL